MLLAMNRLSILAVTTAVLAAAPARAQLQISSPLQAGRTASGSASRASIGQNPLGSNAQQASASVGYTSMGTCSTSSSLTYGLKFLGYSYAQAAYLAVNLAASSNTMVNATSSFDVRVAGTQLVSQRFSSDRTFTGNHSQALPSVQQTIYVSSVGVVVSGSVFVQPSYGLTLQVRNGAASVRQQGQLAATARGSVRVLTVGGRVSGKYDFGDQALTVDLSATGGLGGGGSISGNASCTMGAFRIALDVCYWFVFYEVCNHLFDYNGPAATYPMLSL